MALCARQEYCESDLRSKLKMWGLDGPDTDAVIQDLIGQKFIDELRFTIAYIRDKIRFEHWGPVKIRFMLRAKKIPGDIIDQAFSETDPDTFTEVLKDLLHKKEKNLRSESDPYKRRQKLIRFALSRGFELDQILKISREPGDFD